MYAMGLCSDEESQEVENMMLTYPEIKDEVVSIMQGLENHALAQAQTPPAHIRAEVLSKIANTTREAKVVEMATAKNESNQSSPLSGPVEFKRGFNWMAAASITLLIASVGGNIWLWNKYNSTSRELVALQKDNSTLANNLNATQANYKQSEKLLAYINAPSTQVVKMSGVPLSPESMATVYWNKESREVYLAVQSLPAPPSDKQYQLWAIVDGVPVDAGMVSLTGNDSLYRMKDFSSAQAFAITLEKLGGSAVPSLELMYVVGNS
jgi:anti-sigma-K factor RskA